MAIPTDDPLVASDGEEDVVARMMPLVGDTAVISDVGMLRSEKTT